jgi:hypothetical protein
LGNDVLTGSDAPLNFYSIAVARGVFDHNHRVRALRCDGTRHDFRALTLADRDTGYIHSGPDFSDDV